MICVGTRTCFPLRIINSTMKSLKITFITLFFVVFSCDKENIITKSDNILFTDIDDVTVTSLDSLVHYLHWSGDCYIPYPRDSVAHFDLDINNDGQFDFRISHSHWFGSYLFSPSSFCSNYDNYEIAISSIDNEICADATGFYEPFQLNIGDRLDNDLFWASSVNVYLRSATAMYFYESKSDYLGVKVNKNDSVYYGWILMEFTPYQFTIKEYAINLTGNNSIIVGQKH
jgi:hypothetical protein